MKKILKTILYAEVPQIDHHGALCNGLLPPALFQCAIVHGALCNGLLPPALYLCAVAFSAVALS